MTGIAVPIRTSWTVVADVLLDCSRGCKQRRNQRYTSSAFDGSKSVTLLTSSILTSVTSQWRRNSRAETLLEKLILRLCRGWSPLQMQQEGAVRLAVPAELSVCGAQGHYYATQCSGSMVWRRYSEQ